MKAVGFSVITEAIALVSAVSKSYKIRLFVSETVIHAENAKFHPFWCCRKSVEIAFCLFSHRDFTKLKLIDHHLEMYSCIFGQH